MSGLFQQVMYQLSIKQFKSTAYHPQSQGALKRFHQTLKNMLWTYCVDKERQWDEGVHLRSTFSIFFAAHESVQEAGSVPLNLYLDEQFVVH